MPLDTTGLTTDLTTLFVSPPNTAAECASQWATAIESYSITIVPPSTTVSAAKTTLQISLTSAFENNLNADTTASEMETAFLAFAVTVGLGMAPTFTSTPPSTSVGFRPLLDLTPSTHSEAVNSFVGVIDLWMRTGLAVRNVTPFDTIPWT